MRRLSKIQFSRAIEGKAEVTAEENAQRSSNDKPRRASRLIVTGLVVFLGVGAGWIGGKVLSGRRLNSPPAPPASDTSSGDNSAPLSQPLRESRPPAKRTSAAEKSTPTSQPASEAEQPVVASEPPPKVPRVDKDEGSEIPTADEATKEIGRQALKKMSKEMKKTNRESPPGNKNDNEH